ncbi:helix-turn-helix domain-containing GNAT family N-acetyltransferase [Achromobacter mucicolens]|nr:helix-turn-helix domain-containing GNAT family N-acetyltransferase [Achromobacter mucicolens]MDG9971936.1 helix-turn-helix domain-containing GNAT family N-acetyltransferase [Achromobacter mucicolens]
MPAKSIDEIRSASRTIVRELGFMRPTLAGTAYSASAVHALLEIDAQGGVAAAHLVTALGLEKSSVSRMLAKLIAAGDIAESASAEDARLKQLTLTGQGKALVKKIHAYGRNQVTSAMAHLNPSQQQAVAQGLSEYARALKASRGAQAAAARDTVQIVPGYRPGLVGRVAEMHAAFYSRHSGFGQFFESQVATGMAEFVGRLSEPCNGVWTAIQNDRIVGSIATDGQDLGNRQAHLRWFILDDGCRGSGTGRKLIGAALDFCDRFGFSACQLWTFKGLDAARKLYESVGFKLVHEEDGHQWGSIVTEQQFTRVKPTA